MPELSSLVDRMAGEGSDAWNIHFRAKADQEAGKDVIIMSVGDPDFATPDPIIETAVNALRGGDTHYSEILGRPALRQAIATEMMRVAGSKNWSVSSDNIMVMAGTQNAIFGASLLVLEPGDEIIALDPMYVTYEATWRVAGAKLIRVATPRENGFRPDINAIAAAVTQRTKAIVFATPNNPTGVVFSRDELQAFADIAIQNDLWVISDEVYAAQTFERPHISIAGLEGMADRTITCSSLSKSQAMPGWRVGWMCAPKHVIDHCYNLGLAMLYGVPSFIQEAAIEALTNSRGEMDKMLEVYKTRRDLVLDLLNSEGNLEVLKPEAGMFALIDVSRTGMTAHEFATALYEAEKVSLLGGAPFGQPAAECVRLSFACSEEEIAEGCKRIKRFAQSIS